MPPSSGPPATVPPATAPPAAPTPPGSNRPDVPTSAPTAPPTTDRAGPLPETGLPAAPFVAAAVAVVGVGRAGAAMGAPAARSAHRGLIDAA